MPTFEEENERADFDDVIPINELLEVQGIDMTDYLPTVQSVFDTLDVQAESGITPNEFLSLVDQALIDGATYLDAYLQAKKDEPRQPEKVTVTADRRPPTSGLSLPRPGGSLLARILSENDKRNIRLNLKGIFPGISDAEIDKLVDQLLGKPALVVGLARIGDIPTYQKNGSIHARLKNSQLKAITNALLSLNTVESRAALNRLNSAVLSGRVTVVRG